MAPKLTSCHLTSFPHSISSVLLIYKGPPWLHAVAGHVFSNFVADHFEHGRDHRKGKDSKRAGSTFAASKVPWVGELEPFCMTKSAKVQAVWSCFGRIAMVGRNGKVYLVGRGFNGPHDVMSRPLAVDIKISRCAATAVMVGEHFLIVRLMNGLLLSKAKGHRPGPKEGGSGGSGLRTLKLTEMRFHKQFKFHSAAYHVAREAVRIEAMTCFNEEGHSRCLAVGQHDDVYEWKAPSTDAYHIGTVPGIFSS